MSAVRRLFGTLKGEGALITYMMGGDPDMETSEKLFGALVAGGADMVEVGIPFSDPIADGRSIQEAAVRSLTAGTTPHDVLELVRRVKRDHKVPVAIMTYYNVLYSPGLDRFCREAKAAGVDALIVPDLPFDETGEYSRLARKYSIDTILLAAPTTPPDRMKSLVSHSTGFLYLVSLLGVTGARSKLGDETLRLVRSAKARTRGRIPLGVGFGVSRPEHVRAILDAGADAVIVGSSIVNLASSGKPRDAMLRDVESYVSSLKRATKNRPATHT